MVTLSPLDTYRTGDMRGLSHCRQIPDLEMKAEGHDCRVGKSNRMEKFVRSMGTLSCDMTDIGHDFSRLC